jgi:anti-sigma factor (TIGR02949 family)
VACRRARRILFLWVDRDREPIANGSLARHLEDCPECRARAGEVERVVLLVRTRCGRTSAPGHLVERIRLRIDGV